MNLRTVLINHFAWCADRALREAVSGYLYNFNREYLMSLTNTSVIGIRFVMKEKIEQYGFEK
jgi:hypothetical protein